MLKNRRFLTIDNTRSFQPRFQTGQLGINHLPLPRIRLQLFQEMQNGVICLAGVFTVPVFCLLNARCLRNVHERHGNIEIDEQELHAGLIRVVKPLAHSPIVE